MKKFAVILAGCGVYDGAEIHESVLTLLAIEKNGASYQCFAPDISQYHVINHLTGKEMPETRNVLVESARISRGAIKPLQTFIASDFDALILPGGFGCAKNLCTWAIEGDSCTVDSDMEKAIKSMADAGKPVGAMCIAPVILAKIFKGSLLTTGKDPASAGFIERMGNKFVLTSHGAVVVDKNRNLYTTPCYMLDSTITQIAEGTENIVKAMIQAID